MIKGDDLVESIIKKQIFNEKLKDGGLIELSEDDEIEEESIEDSNSSRR